MWREAVVYAQDAAPGEGGSSSPFGNPIFFMILIFGVFYFLLIRPNQKRERTRREMLASLSKGSKVVTNGGICGTILGLNEKTVVLKVSDDPVTKIEFLRTAISQVATEEENTQKT
ncbi:MAG: preprotein translocase subunit YajC [Candidatus Hydrogenedentes bacterium]|nr:preprotein translocase subunit YajC [Candidatus Hydrogenedentota bacterium]